MSWFVFVSGLFGIGLTGWGVSSELDGGWSWAAVGVTLVAYAVWLTVAESLARR